MKKSLDLKQIIFEKIVRSKTNKMYLHIIWWQGYDEMPDNYKSYLDIWRIKTKYTVIFWAGDTIQREFIKTFPQYAQKFCNLELIQKCDIGRYFILWKFGGIYVDADSYCMNDPSDYLYNLFKDDTTILAIGKMAHTGIYDINNSVIVSEKNHPIWLDIFSHIFSLDLNKKNMNLSKFILGGQLLLAQLGDFSKNIILNIYLIIYSLFSLLGLDLPIHLMMNKFVR